MSESKVDDALLTVYAECVIDAQKNAIVVCGPLTGHVYEPIAFCNDPLTARLLANALKAYCATLSKSKEPQNG